jgi:hypothetical protein
LPYYASINFMTKHEKLEVTGRHSLSIVFK